MSFLSEKTKSKNDFFSRIWDSKFVRRFCREEDEREKNLGELSAGWFKRSFWGEGVEARVLNFLEIQSAVRSLVQVHGVPFGTTVEFLKFYGGPIKKYGSSGYKDLDTYSGPYICLDRDIYDEIAEKDRIDCYCGIGLHEASHLNHSKEFIHRLNEKPTLSKIKYFCWNWLEDVRIEEKIYQESPGFAQYVRIAKKCLFEDRKHGTAQAIENFGSSDEVSKAMNIAFMYIRFPHLATDEMINFVASNGRNIWNATKHFVPRYPETVEEVCDWGTKIAEMIEDLMKSKLTEDTEKKDAAEENNETQEGFEYQAIVENRGKQSDSEGEKILKERLKALLDKRKEEGKFGLIELQELLRDFVQRMTEEESELKVNWEELKLERGDEYEGKFKTVVTYPRGTDEEAYQNSYGKVKSHIAAMRNIFRLRASTRIIKEPERKRGWIDRDRLALAECSERIFYETTTYETAGLSICVLLDASGSMCGPPIDRARDVGVLLIEALQGIPKVELEVYSYGSEGFTCWIENYYGKKNKNRRAIGDYQSGIENYDGVAILEVAKRFDANTTGKEKILLVVSDGDPDAPGYRGNPAIVHTRKAVEKVSKRMKVIQIAVAGVNSKKMFRHFVKFRDFSQLVQEMRKVVIRIMKQAYERQA